MFGAGFRSTCIGSEQDPQRHGQMKKSLSPAFSTKALAEQECIVVRVIDDFVRRIGEDGGPRTRGLNMTKWYDMCAFDILGEMAFGESFHCIESGALGKTPPPFPPFPLLFFAFSWLAAETQLPGVRKTACLGRTHSGPSLFRNACRQP